LRQRPLISAQVYKLQAAYKPHNTKWYNDQEKPTAIIAIQAARMEYMHNEASKNIIGRTAAEEKDTEAQRINGI